MRKDLIAMYNEHFDEVLQLEEILPHSLNTIDLVRRIKKLNAVCRELDSRINPPAMKFTDISVQIEEVY